MIEKIRKENRYSIRENKKWSSQKRRKIEARENEKKLEKLRKEQRVKTFFNLFNYFFVGSSLWCVSNLLYHIGNSEFAVSFLSLR